MRRVKVRFLCENALYPCVSDRSVSALLGSLLPCAGNATKVTGGWQIRTNAAAQAFVEYVGGLLDEQDNVLGASVAHETADARRVLKEFLR